MLGRQTFPGPFGMPAQQLARACPAGRYLAATEDVPEGAARAGAKCGGGAGSGMGGAGVGE